jgi:hypothetical protein
LISGTATTSQQVGRVLRTTRASGCAFAHRIANTLPLNPPPITTRVWPPDSLKDLAPFRAVEE